MKIRHSCVVSVSILVAAAGAAIGQERFKLAPVDRSPDGDVLVREWRLGTGERMQIGRDGRPASGAVDLTPQFVAAGTSPEADSHSSLAYTPDGLSVVIANRASKNLTVFDPATRALIRNIPLTGSPQSVAITPNGARAVTANMVEGTVSIVDLATGAELFTTPVGANPVVAKITPNGLSAVVSSNGPQNMAVIDIATGAVVRTIATGGYQTVFSINFESQGVGFQSTGPTVVDDTTVIYPDYSNSRVLVIDITTGVVTQVPTAANPTGVAIAAGKAFISHYFPGTTVSRIDIASRTVDATYTVPSQINGPISANPAGTFVAVAVQNACVVIKTADGTNTGLLSATASVNQLITTTDGQFALAVGFNGSLISYATQSVVGNTNQFVSCSIGAVSPTAARAVMLSDTFGEDMVVVRTDTPALLSGAPTGPAPEGDKTRVAVLNPTGTKAVGINQFSQTATVVDVATASQLGIVGTGRRPGGAVVTPDGTRALIANRDGTTLTVVNLSTLATTNIGISTRGDQIQVSPDNQYAYCAVVVGDGVWRVNLNTNATAGFIPTGNMGGFFQGYQSTSGMTLSHNGATLVTCDSFDNRISVIDTATWALVAAVPLGAGNFPVRAIFSPDDSKIYVTNRDSDRISVLSNAGAGSAVTGTIIVGDSPTEMAITPDGSKLYVLNWGNPNVGVVNTATLSQTSTITFPANRSVDGFVLSPDASRLYVTHNLGTYTLAMGGFTIAQNGAVNVIDTATNGVVDTMNSPDIASGISIAGNGSALALPNIMSEGLTVVSLGAACYANCDASSVAPILNANDFQCFLNRYAANDSYANCDGSTVAPILNANDFQCFLNSYAAGCS